MPISWPLQLATARALASGEPGGQRTGRMVFESRRSRHGTSESLVVSSESDSESSFKFLVTASES
jgi:hypothetical protein